MLQEDGAHLSFGFAVLHPVVPAVGAQSEWHRASGLVLLQTHHPAADVQEDSPSLPFSLTQVFQLEVSGLSATEGAGRWVKGRGSAALGTRHCSSPSRRDQRGIAHVD